MGLLKDKVYGISYDNLNKIKTLVEDGLIESSVKAVFMVNDCGMTITQSRKVIETWVESGGPDTRGLMTKFLDSLEEAEV